MSETVDGCTQTWIETPQLLQIGELSVDLASLPTLGIGGPLALGCYTAALLAYAKWTHGLNAQLREELEENKNKIVETLSNYKIGIASIKATIGPTVTLYEIVPDAGVRISKIKNLEDDIALSLSALGIRIIAPIPGKGTIFFEIIKSHHIGFSV